MTYWLSERILLRDIVIIRSYCTVAGVWRSRKVSGKRKVFGSRTVKETDRGRTIEKGNVCRPQSLLFSDAGEGERLLPVFAQTGMVTFRKEQTSSIPAPVMTRPVTLKNAPE